MRAIKCPKSHKTDVGRLTAFGSTDFRVGLPGEGLMIGPDEEGAGPAR